MKILICAAYISAQLTGTCVVDGDTIHSNGEKIRLADIDAPEIWHFKCAQELILGLQARNRLADLMEAGFEVTSAGKRDTDKYGRKLRLITHDGVSLGAVLVNEGLAVYYAYPKHDWC